MKHNLLKSSAAVVLAGLLCSQTAMAQDESVEDVIVVTGSNIKKSSFNDLASPVANLDKSQFEKFGAKDLRDVIDTLTINTGSQNNADVFTAGYTTGTSNINLRGLGVASTLVLLNGKRQVVAGVPTTDGVLFVDTSALVPNIAVDRLEILKDGASAIYGSEAVAGVANFITRDRFTGLELTADYQFRAASGDQTDFKLEGIAGVEGDYGNLVFAMSYLDRTPLYGEEAPWLSSIEGTNLSGVGSPGTYLGVSAEAAAAVGSVQTGPFTPDPQCEELGGVLIALCRFDFHDQQTVVPKENRIQGFAKYTGNIGSIGTFAEMSFARTRAARNTSPSYPFILDNATVPADAPSNVFGEEVRYFGRPLGSGQPATENTFESDTFRLSTGLDGEIGSWDWNLSYTRGISDGEVTQEDTIVDNFISAVAGFGGEDCPVRAAGLGVDAGDTTQGCFYWNTFGSQFTDPALANGPEVTQFIFGEQVLDTKSDTTVIDFVTSGEVGIELGGGAVGVAVGAQYREESLEHGYDTLSNLDSFSFLVGNPDFEGSRDGYAVFGEAALPFTENLEVQAALRYEKIGDLDTLDPKVGVVWTASDWAKLRGSYSTSFRAPSTFQFIGTQTTFTQVGFQGSTNFISQRAVGSEDLVPETSRAFNIGGTFDVGALNLSVDFTDFSFEDVLTVENAQVLVSALDNDLAAAANDAERAAAIANNPQVLLTPGGTVGQVVSNFINANAIDTQVLDVSADYTFETEFADITPFVEGTYVVKYDLTNASGDEIDGAGSRNFRNFGSPTPTLRFNAGIGVNKGPHSGNLIVRRISGLENDENDGDDSKGQTTFDAQYSYEMDEVLGAENAVFTVGVINLANEDPPFVRTNGNYEARAYDPRGRRVYARVKVGF